MSSVWYIGRSDGRTITSDQWTAVGAAGASVTWDAKNGYSIPASVFTPAQLAVLAASTDFNTAAPDGPRPGGAMSGQDQKPLNLADLYNLGVYPVEEPSGVVARAAIATGVTSVFGSTPALILGCMVIIPPSKRPVTVRGGATMKLNSAVPAGAGAYANLIIYELTNAPVIAGFASMHLKNTMVNGDIIGTPYVEQDIGPSASWRRFHLYVNASASVLGVTLNSTQQESWIEGVIR